MIRLVNICEWSRDLGHQQNIATASGSIPSVAKAINRLTETNEVVFMKV